MHDRTTTIDAFLTATAAKQPTPGGGSVAALTGALAAAIGEMVLSYSIGKRDLLANEPQLRHVAGELQRARELLLQLMAEDQEAYAELTAVRKLPHDQPGHREQLRAAVWVCVRGPQAVGAIGVAVLDLCEQVVDHVNRFLLSDLAVCAELAMATVRSAACNVRVNLSSLDPADDPAKLRGESEELVAHAVVRVQRLTPRIWARVEAP